MSSPPRSIYRQEALDYRLRRRDQSPPVAPARFQHLKAALWVALVVTVSAAAAAFLVPVSTLTSALAVSPATPLGDGYVAVLFDPEDAAGILPGALVSIEAPGAPGTRHGSVVAVEPDRVDPAWIERTFELPSTMTAAFPQQLGLAWVEIGNGGTLAPGTIGAATIEAQDVPAGAVIPIIGRWFGGRA